MRLAIPYTDQDEINEVATVLATGYLTQGPKVAEFEGLIAALVGSRFAFAATSATTALHLSLAALGLQPGDEVLLPDFTFPATANVVIQLGARPVLVDIDLSTFNLNPNDCAAKLTPRTRAVMPVHLFGLPAQMQPLMELAHAHGLWVVEDAACAIGAACNGRQVGGFGHAGCFSFHPRKVITTGEGGMITTNDEALAQRISLLRSHGGLRAEGRFTFVDAGYNYRMSDLQAAVGVAQMRKLPEIIARRRALAAQLTAMLAGLPGLTPPSAPPGCDHIYQAYVILLDQRYHRDAVIAALRRRQIESTLGTYALHTQPAYQSYGCIPGGLPNSHYAYEHSLALPFYPQMTTADLEMLADALEQSLGESQV
jgi:dTDP-4-amino-4,6-dideoxygalactose transaminase